MILNTQTTITERYQEAVEFSTSGDFDLAQACFLECVTVDPGNVEFVDGMLGNLARKFGLPQNVNSLNGDPPAALQRAVDEKNWAEVLLVGPRQLATNPWHVPTLRALAEANAAEGDHDVELRYLKMARDAAPDDVELHRHSGKSLARARKFEEALACWQRIETLQPDDAEAARMIAQLTVEKSRQLAGMPRDNDESVAAQAKRRERRRTLQKQPAVVRFDEPIRNRNTPRPASNVKRTPIQQLELAIREFPSDPENYVRLTPLYLEAGRDYDAERLLTKARQATDDDARVRYLWEDVTMLRLEKKVELARKHADVNTTTEAQEELDAIVSKRDRTETDIFVERCKREPHNAAMRIQLGLRLKQAGRVRDACQRFEEALEDADQKCFAAFELAECQQQFDEFPEAFRLYRLAAESATQPEQLECQKRALYQAGKLATRIKMDALARRYLAAVVRIDPQYQDAAELLQCKQQRGE